MESVILETPILLCGFALALVLCAFSLFKKLHFAFGIAAALIFSATATYALLLGAELYEVALCAVVFFITNLSPSLKGRDDR